MTNSDGSLETRTYHKVDVRLLPFLFLCYILAYLDRVNVGFAMLQMLKDLSMSDVAFVTGCRHFLYRLFLLRSSQQCSLEEIRGARVDC